MWYARNVLFETDGKNLTESIQIEIIGAEIFHNVSCTSYIEETVQRRDQYLKFEW